MLFARTTEMPLLLPSKHPHRHAALTVFKNLFFVRVDQCTAFAPNLLVTSRVRICPKLVYIRPQGGFVLGKNVIFVSCFRESDSQRHRLVEVRSKGGVVGDRKQLVVVQRVVEPL